MIEKTIKYVLIAISFFLIFFLASLAFGQTLIPLNEYSYAEIFKDKTVTTYTQSPIFYNDGSGLKPIDNNIVVSPNRDWNFETTKGVFQTFIKEDGTFKFQVGKKFFTTKLKSLVFYNILTKDFNESLAIVLSNPRVSGNRISWQLGFDCNYFIEVSNNRIKDVFFLSSTIREYLRQRIPTGPTKNFRIGLLYDMNAEKSGIEDSAIETTNRIKFLDGNDVLFSFRESVAVAEDWNHFWYDSLNENKQWLRFKKFSLANNLFIDAIDLNALNYKDKGIYFNNTVTYDVNTSSDDADEWIPLEDPAVRLTGTSIYLGNLRFNDTTHVGIRFQRIDLNKFDNISEATLKMKGGRTCAIGVNRCDNRIFGVEENYPLTWSNTNLISDRNYTKANLDWNETTTFTPNAVYETYDKNVTAIIQELMNHPNWNNLDPIAFAIKELYAGNLKGITIYAFDNGSKYPQLQITSTKYFPIETACTPFATHNWNLSKWCYYYDQNNQNIGNHTLFIDYNSGIYNNNSIISAKKISCKNRLRDFTTKAVDLNALTNFPGYSPSSMSWSLPDTRHSGNAWQGEYPMTKDNWIEINFQDGNEYFVYNSSFGVMYDNGFPSDINIQYYNSSKGWTTIRQDSTFTVAECDANGYSPGTGAGGNHYFCDVNATVNDLMQKVRLNMSFKGMKAGAVLDLNWLAASEIIAYGKDFHWNKMQCLLDTNFGRFVLQN